jgi:glycosyltransferase involved in cell wall biosynthesis
MAPAHVAPATGSIRAAVPPMRPGPRAAATVAFVHRGLGWTPGGEPCLLDRLRASLGIPGEALLAVAIGSLIHRKGHDVTLRGVALARARGADVHLLLCGDGEAADTLRALAAELGVRLAPRGTLGASVRAVGRPGHTSADGLGELVAPGRRPESRPRRRGGPTVISW